MRDFLCLTFLLATFSGRLQAQDPPTTAPSYTSDQGYMGRLEKDFNEDIGNEPDSEGALPEGWVYFDMASNAASAPSGATHWTVYFEPGQSGFAGTRNVNGWTSTILDYEFAEVNLDPSPLFPGVMDGEELYDFWLFTLWHEWHHSIHADPSDFDYDPENPPVTLPTPGQWDCDHMKLDVIGLNEACSRVSSLIVSEEITGEKCKRIRVLCRYIALKVENFSGSVFHHFAENCPDLNPIPGTNPPAYHNGCLCCLTYAISALCADISTVTGLEFLNHNFEQIDE